MGVATGDFEDFEFDEGERVMGFYGSATA